MKNIFFNPLNFVFLLFAILPVFPCQAEVPFRFGGGLGVWGGNFSENYGSAKSSLTLSPAFGLHAFVGLPFHKIFYVQWSPSLWTPGKLDAKSSSPSAATYFSPLAVEFGFSGLNSLETLPPLDAYLGLEYGGLKFLNGTKTSVSGTAVKLGIDYFPLHVEKWNHFGLRAEYKKHFTSIDNHAPIDVDVGLSTYYIGFVYAFSIEEAPPSSDAAPAP